MGIKVIVELRAEAGRRHLAEMGVKMRRRPGPGFFITRG